MTTILRHERGSAMILAVIAMAILAVLGVSFALLADVESRMGVAYKQQAQAEALAEAGLERARDAVRTAVSAPGGFTNWFNGTNAAHMLFSGVSLNNGTYTARIDNDCAAVIPGFPAGIQEPNHEPGAQPCDNAADHNEIGVLTAWATSNSGRARVRAVVGVDNPWKHVCSNAKPDNNGYCNEPGNRNGSPEISPADPSDPNGPAAYEDLPRPVLGCSRVAPGLHRGPHALGTQVGGCAANGLMYTYPYPVAFNAPPRLVLMGQDPAVDATAKRCNPDPADPSRYYFGYFDCALTTFCDPNPPFNMPCGSWGLRKACVPLADSRVTTDPAHYVAYDPVNGKCGAGPGTGFTNETGLVCMDWAGGCNFFGTDVGSQAMQFTMYVFRRNWSQGNNRAMYGTLIVEGPPIPGGAIIFQVGGGGASRLWTGPNTCPAQPPWVASNQYGFPLVALVYNPELPAPTVSPTYAPQDHFADFGSANTEIHGMAYSGGHVQFNPLAVDGTIVAYEIQTQGSANYVYNTCYGLSSPPPGFPYGSSNQVVIIRKSFVVCASWRDDSPGPSACN
jgi:Tfp pilus assembly protein PilX